MVREPAAGTGRRLPFGVFTTDDALVIRTWDAWLAAITGIATREALGRPLADVLPGVEPSGVLSILRNVLAHGTIEVLSPALHRGLIEHAPSDGESASARLHQRVTIGPIREDGCVTGVAVTIEDVTARVEYERELAGRLAEGSIDTLTRALGDEEWRRRQAAVTQLAAYGPAIVDSLVKTLREQHRNFSVLSSTLDLLALTDIDVVGPLIECLADEDPDLRIQAALILGERRDLRAVPPLIRALEDPDLNVRFHAIEALGSLRAAEASEPLLEIAERRDFFLAFPAIQVLGQLGDVSAAPRLVPLLSDELLRAAVAEALGQLGDEVVAVPLVRLLNEPDAPSEVVADALADLYARYETRYGAGEHIASLVRRHIGPAGTQNLLDAVGRVHSDRLRGIARVLGWLSGPAAERALTRLLGQRAVRAQVVEALVRYGAGVVDLLIEQLRAEDLDTRQAAAVALGRIGDARATAALADSLSDPELALPAAGALARIGDGAAFGALMALVGHDDTAVRQAAVAALNSIGHADMPIRIVTLLDDANPNVRESAVKIAGYFGYPQCTARVLARCSDPSEAVRRAAVEHLPFFEDPAAVPALIHALASDTPPVRAAAAGALAHVDPDQAIPPLAAALGDADPWVRYFALRSLGDLGRPGVTPVVLDLVRRDPAGQVRLAAIDVLGRLNAAGATAVLEPLTMLEERDLARAAIRGLGHLDDPAAQPILERLLRAGETWRRLEAVRAVGARGGPKAVPALEWIAAADDDPEIVAAAVGVLALLASREDEDGAAIAALISLTAEPSRREAAIGALAAVPHRRAVDVAAGVRHYSPDVRRATVEALGRMKHPDASHWIERALDDPFPGVRAAAVAELRRLGSRTAGRKLLALARTDPDLEVRHAAMMAVSQQRGDAPPAADGGL